MPSAKVTTSSATKSVGVQTAAKSSEAFSINGKKITHSSSSITATNISDALEEVATQVAVQAAINKSEVPEDVSSRRPKTDSEMQSKVY